MVPIYSLIKMMIVDYGVKIVLCLLAINQPDKGQVFQEPNTVRDLLKSFIENSAIPKVRMDQKKYIVLRQPIIYFLVSLNFPKYLKRRCLILK